MSSSPLAALVRRRFRRLVWQVQRAPEPAPWAEDDAPEEAQESLDEAAPWPEAEDAEQPHWVSLDGSRPAPTVPRARALASSRKAAQRQAAAPASAAAAEAPPESDSAPPSPQEWAIPAEDGALSAAGPPEAELGPTASPLAPLPPARPSELGPRASAPGYHTGAAPVVRSPEPRPSTSPQAEPLARSLPPAPTPPAEAPVTRRGFPEVPPAEALFREDGRDRSPQAWLERLRRAALAEPPAPAQTTPAPWAPLTAAPPRRAEALRAQPAQPRRLPAAEGLPLVARPVIEALTGLDAARVTRIEGEDVDRALDALSAEGASLPAARTGAETLPPIIAVHRRVPSGSPRLAGLLAHELVHVAQGLLEVPAAASDEASDPGAVPDGTAAGAPVVAPADARWAAPPLAPTQAPVRRTPPLLSPEAATRPSEGWTPPHERLPLAVEAAVGAHGADPRWGGLPAPWEPLPPLPPTAAPPAPTLPAPVSTNAERTPPKAVPETRPPAPAPAAPAHPQEGISLAELARTLPGPAPQPENPPAALPPERPTATTEADLDDLSRQVYAILRRRLDLEARRTRH